MARTLYALLHVVAALILLSVAGMGGVVVLLGFCDPPPLLTWAREGVVGTLASVILIAGTVLWAVLSLATLIWTFRCIRRAIVTLMGRYPG